MKNIVWQRVSIGLAAGATVAALSQTAVAQQHAHGTTASQQPADAAPVNALVAAVRNATQRFQNVRVAQDEGYALAFGCVAGSGDEGAMGLHYVNGPLVGDGTLDVNQPEAILYEMTSTGQLQLTAVEYVVLADAWNAKNPAPPQLMGQFFHFQDAPNRFGLPPFYMLHVWAWKPNPNGTFANWNPYVSCDAYSVPGGR